MAVSRIFVNGPAAIQVGTGTANALEQLGFTENGVRISLDGKFEDIHTDLSGPLVPYDVQFMGEEAFITLDLNKYVEAVYAKLAARVPNVAFTATWLEGAPAAKGIGTLMSAESGTVRCLIVSPYQTKTAFSTMPAGYNFLSCYPVATIDLDPVGLRTKKARIIMRAIGVWSAPASYSYTLYDHSTTGIATVE